MSVAEGQELLIPKDFTQLVFWKQFNVLFYLYQYRYMPWRFGTRAAPHGRKPDRRDNLPHHRKRPPRNNLEKIKQKKSYKEKVERVRLFY
jgi:hypothetical protein